MFEGVELAGAVHELLITERGGGGGGGGGGHETDQQSVCGVRM